MRNFRGGGLRNFRGGGVEKFSGGGCKIFGGFEKFSGRSSEIFGGGDEKFSGRGLSREGLNFFGRGDIFSGGVGNFLGPG